jgi:hypothetical protein
MIVDLRNVLTLCEDTDREPGRSESRSSVERRSRTFGRRANNALAR